jgi:hypothetical protein
MKFPGENDWQVLAPCVIRSRFLGKYRGICLVCQRRFSLKRLRFLEWLERDPGKGIAGSASFMVWEETNPRLEPTDNLGHSI